MTKDKKSSRCKRERPGRRRRLELDHGAQPQTEGEDRYVRNKLKSHWVPSEKSPRREPRRSPRRNSNPQETGSQRPVTPPWQMDWQPRQEPNTQEAGLRRPTTLPQLKHGRPFGTAASTQKRLVSERVPEQPARQHSSEAQGYRLTNEGSAKQNLTQGFSLSEADSGLSTLVSSNKTDVED